MIRPDSPTAARIHQDVAEGRRIEVIREEHRTALAAADRLQGPAKDRFRSLVGHVGQRLAVGGIGVHPIAQVNGTGRFELAENGPQALILPVRLGPNRLGIPLTDLLAWVPREELLLTRYGTPVLGWDHLSAVCPDAPILVHADPGTWCRANGQGIVVLDWTRAWGELGHLPTLAVDTVEFGRFVEGALKPPPVRRPRILVRREAVAA